MQCIAISAVQCWSVIEGGNTNRTRGICSTQPSYWGAGGAEKQGQHRLQREQRVEHHEQEEHGEQQEQQEQEEHEEEEEQGEVVMQICRRREKNI